VEKASVVKVTKRKMPRRARLLLLKPLRLLPNLKVLKPNAVKANAVKEKKRSLPRRSQRRSNIIQESGPSGLVSLDQRW